MKVLKRDEVSGRITEVEIPVAEGVNLYIQDSTPSVDPGTKFMWIQTNVGGNPADFQVWFDDGT